ncbi:MAG: LuxR C-terminal-related transcriptional regulator [Phycisphaerales bacterium]
MEMLPQMTQQAEIFELLNHEPGTGVSVVDRDGVTLYINSESIRIFFGEPRTPEMVIGKNLVELGFAKEWADERVELIRRIERTGEECLLRTIWQGKQQFSWFRAIGDVENGEAFRVLVVTRRVGAGEEADLLLESELSVIKSEVAGLGDLSELTKRELEVLAMIGQGLTAKEIAALLHRSVKTVENHRIALGNKLKKSNKVELALMARAAGLMVDDSERLRVD